MPAIVLPTDKTTMLDPSAEARRDPALETPCKAWHVGPRQDSLDGRLRTTARNWRSVISVVVALSATSGCSDDEPDGDVDPRTGDPFKPATPPTPGSVTFSESSRTYEGHLSVSLSTEVPGATIRYTTDGSIPTASSTAYDGTPLEFDDTVEVRAQAFADDGPRGTSSTAIYIARTFDASSELPLVILEAFGGGKPQDKDTFRDVALMTFEASSGNAALSAMPTVATRAGWHLRGQSSATFEKAPYRVELWDEQDQDQDYNLAGLPAEADWAFIGPFVDRTLIRNPLSYDLGREMGLEAPRYALVEVYINLDGGPLSPDDYEGVYMLSETIKNSRNRLNLKDLDPEDTDEPTISGGYIFKFDWAAIDDGANLFECTGSNPISTGGFGGGGRGGGGFGSPAASGTCWSDLEVVDPDPINSAQKTWMEGYLQSFHDALHAEPMGDYAEYIDVDSFVNHFLINEFTRDLDANVRSTYFFKERDGKIVAGPLWDYNLTFLAGGAFDNTNPEGWQFQQRTGSNDWYHLLATDPGFMVKVAARWSELRRGILSDASIDDRITAMTAPLVDAAERDFQRWPVRAVSGSFFRIPSGDTWAAQLQAIRDWIPRRLAWLDQAVNLPIETGD